MDREFERMPGNRAVSVQGFEVSVIGGSEIRVEYQEPGKQVSISAERLTTGGIGLFMNWAEFPDGPSEEEKRTILERVVRGLWAMEISVDETEIHPAEQKWPLPLRPKK